MAKSAELDDDDLPPARAWAGASPGSPVPPLANETRRPEVEIELAEWYGLS